MKKCKRCSTVKEICHFHKDKNQQDGHWVYCKPCERSRRARPLPHKKGGNHTRRVGECNPGWKGGMHIKRSGYVAVSINGRKVHQHVLIAEKVLGRRLKPNEVVHHINGIKSDNRNSNLLICTKSYHAWLHHEMSRRYALEHFGGC